MSSTGERYPGMKASATRLFKECPRSKHGELTRQMKFFSETAKAQGKATTMDWNSQNLYTLKKLFGMPPQFAANVVHSGRQNTNQSTEIKRDQPITKEAASRGPQLSKDIKRDVTPTMHALPKQSDKIKLTQPINLHPRRIHQDHAGMRTMKTHKKEKNPGRILHNKSTAESRRERFQNSAAGSASPYKESQIIGTIVGTSTQLEKPYFRLTGQVNPAVVRPPIIIAQALPYVLSKYQEGKGYGYATSQLQSIRQDLTVQHIESELTIFVYEINARLALFHDDLGEFNKCLTRSTDLYIRNPDAAHNKNEFKAYSVYYMLSRQKWDELSLISKDFDPQEPIHTTTVTVRPDTHGVIAFSPTAYLYPTDSRDQLEMIDRAIVCIHNIQRQDLFSLMSEYRAAWPLEKKSLNQIVQREQAKGLEGLLLAVKPQNQSLPLKQITSWSGLQSQPQSRKLLDSWRIPYSANDINAEHSLSHVQRANIDLGGFDIKGQI